MRKNLPDALLHWFRRNRLDVPWRRTHDPYRIWVSEVMLQQTQVSTVIPYYRRFIARFPTVRVLAASREQAVLKAWEGLGYYARARNLRKGAQHVSTRYKGRLPAEKDLLLQIPGVGEYTANAILSIAFNRPCPVYDGNVRRVMARLQGLAAPPLRLDSPSTVKSTLETWVKSAKSPGELNQAIMELGQRICTPRRPRCGECSMLGDCHAYATGDPTAFPTPKRRRAVPHYNIAVGVAHRSGKVLIQRRPSEGLLGGLWEFPGGKIRRGESARAAVVRELNEEVGLLVHPVRKLARVDHTYSHFSVTLHVFLCHLVSGALTNRSARWVPVAHLRRYPFPSANLKFLDRVKSGGVINRRREAEKLDVVLPGEGFHGG